MNCKSVCKSNAGQADSTRISEILNYHRGHDDRYLEDCPACIAKAAWNFSHNIDDLESRRFLSKLSIAYRDENVAEINRLVARRSIHRTN